MGTRALLVFRIKGKVVLQVFVHLDGYPDGVPAKVAKILLELVGEVQVHALIVTIVAALKETAGYTVLQSITHPYGTKLFTRYSWVEYGYVFYFHNGELEITDQLEIDVIDHYSYMGNGCSVERYNVPKFASLCGLEVQLPYIRPTYKFDTPLDEKEFVQMVGKDGHPLFFMAVKKGWYQNLSRFVLDIELRDTLDRERKAIGDTAVGSDCLAAQILKKTKEFCADDALILSHMDMKQDHKLIHTIAFYNVASVIAIHDEDPGIESSVPAPHIVQGIHSHNRVVKKVTKHLKLLSPPPHKRARRGFPSYPSLSFLAWAVSNMRNRANWKRTSVKQLRNVVLLITLLAKYCPPRPSVKREFSRYEEQKMIAAASSWF